MQKNMPARRVLRDDLIVELAKHASADAKKIAQIRGLHHPGFQRFIPEIADCVAVGLKAPVPEAPWTRQSKRPRPPALLQQFLTAAMSYLCRTNNISPTVVGTSDDVGRLASYWMGGSEMAADHEEFPHLLRGWRADLVGKPLYDIFTGRKALHVQDPQDEMPLALCDRDQ
jgi:ribonuclease D